MNEKTGTATELDLFQHLGELRKRLLWSVVAIAAGACVAFNYSEIIFRFLSAPYDDGFKGAALIGTGPAEAFLLRLQMSVFSGLIVSAPVVFWQLWLFVAPGLYEHERKLAIPFVFCTTLLFFLGVGFCYYGVLPVSFAFFKTQYDAIAVTPTVRISEHLSLILKALIGFGVIFELPVLTFFLARFGIVTAGAMRRARRYAIVAIFILAAILTPPDVLSQLLMAAPLLVLYELSIIVAAVVGKPDVGSEKVAP